MKTDSTNSNKVDKRLGQVLQKELDDALAASRLVAQRHKSLKNQVEVIKLDLEQARIALKKHPREPQVYRNLDSVNIRLMTAQLKVQKFKPLIALCRAKVSAARFKIKLAEKGYGSIFDD